MRDLASLGAPRDCGLVDSGVASGRWEVRDEWVQQQEPGAPPAIGDLCHTSWGGVSGADMDLGDFQGWPTCRNDRTTSSESLAHMPRNAWSTSVGMGGPHASEWVAHFARNPQP